MESNEHGGSCCGMFHLYNFPEIDKGKVSYGWDGKTKKAEVFLREAIDSCRDDAGMNERLGEEDGDWVDGVYYAVRYVDGGWIEVPADPQPERGAKNDKRVIESVLTDQQLSSGWGKYLRAAGFTPVSRFFNSNSGNTCTVFHLHPDGVSVDPNLIPTWGDDTPVMQG